MCTGTVKTGDGFANRLPSGHKKVQTKITAFLVGGGACPQRPSDSSGRGGGWGRRGRVPRFAAASWGNGPIYGVKLPILRQDRHMENYAHALTLGSGFRLSPAER